MQAVILAGGKAERLKPYSLVVPKTLMPIGQLTILEIILRQLSSQGFTRVTLLLSHMSDHVIHFLDQNPALKSLLSIDLIEEHIPGGTAGGLTLIKDPEDHFLVMNGDILTSLDFADFFWFHLQQEANISVASYPYPISIPYGVLEIDEKGYLKEIREKPVISYPVSMGIYACSKRVVELIRDNESLDFPTLIQRVLDRNERIRIFSRDCLWLDVGNPDSLIEANRIFSSRMSDFLPVET